MNGLIKRLDFSGLRRDQWRSLHGSLSPEERRILAFRRWTNRFYMVLRGAVLLPISILRGVAHLVSLLIELERLHFKPTRRMSRGFGCVIDRQTWLINGHNIRLGNNVKISAFSSVMAGYNSTITIGDNTIIGPGVTIVAFNHGFKDKATPFRFQAWEDSAEHSVAIGSNVWIGARAIVLPSSVIEDNSIIAAGAIVRGPVPSDSVLMGELSTRLVPISFRA